MYEFLVSETVNKYDKIVILGKPGCGKMTLLKYIALLMSGHIENVALSKNKYYFPLLIILREFQESKLELKNYINKKIQKCGFPHADLFLDRLLKNDKVILMLDGLDEVTKEKSKVIKEQIDSLLSEYPDNKIVLSCRTAAFKETYENFIEVEVEDFDQPQKYRFIKNWFGKDPKAQNLIKLLKKQSRLSELAQNPLLISLICILYQRNLDIPKNRVELYDKCIETMLHEWDVSRGFKRKTKYDKLSDPKKIKLFNYIVNYFFSKGEKVFTSEEISRVIGDYIQKYGIPSEESGGILKEIESHHGILLPISVKAYCFSHLTFQEYFTACYLVDTRSENLVFRFIDDPRWIEIFVIITNLLEDATGFLERIITYKAKDSFYKLCLAAYCMSGEVAVTEQFKQNVVGSLLKEMTTSSNVLSRLYITHFNPSGTLPGIYFEVDKKSIRASDKKLNNWVKFLGTINCMVNIFNSSFLEELKLLCKKYESRKYYKILEYLIKTKSEERKAYIYSNALKSGGIELPIDVSIFHRSIPKYLQLDEVGRYY